jgi:putative exporter of polyketide antibiotics
MGRQMPGPEERRDEDSPATPPRIATSASDAIFKTLFYAVTVGSLGGLMVVQLVRAQPVGWRTAAMLFLLGGMAYLLRPRARGTNARQDWQDPRSWPWRRW